jgi:phosphate starvation-inducible protein PhoH and related proteins
MVAASGIEQSLKPPAAHLRLGRALLLVGSLRLLAASFGLTAFPVARYAQNYISISVGGGKAPKLMKQTVRLIGGINELFGTLDENLKLFESSLNVTTHLKDHDLEIEGAPVQVERAAQILGEYNDRIRKGGTPDALEVKALLRVATEEPASDLRGAFSPSRTRALGKKNVAPKSANQKRYIEALETHDMTFAIGPGGTGKTYLAVALAVHAMLSKQVNRIILARPAVEAGERLGFLPGTLEEKVDPYMRPLYDALHDLLEAEKLERFLEKGIIEVAPLAFMRGRTLNDSFVILDEAQNTTSEQMKMFLTRLGFNSKAVITGDITQIDLPANRRSGLVEAIDVVGRIEGIAMVYFDERDVVRHNLVQRIIKAYDEYNGAQENGSPRGAAAAAAGVFAKRTARNNLVTMIVNRQRLVPVRLPGLEKFWATAQKRLRIAPEAVSVCFVTDAVMARWNQLYRRKRGPTDVLSFRSDELASGRTRPRSRAMRSSRRAARDEYLGDIAIAPAVARGNAGRLGRTLDNELRILILHGLLHLMGYDHETDEGQMDRRERRLRQELKLA